MLLCWGLFIGVKLVWYLLKEEIALSRAGYWWVDYAWLLTDNYLATFCWYSWWTHTPDQFVAQTHTCVAAHSQTSQTLAWCSAHDTLQIAWSMSTQSPSEPREGNQTRLSATSRTACIAPNARECFALHYTAWHTAFRPRQPTVKESHLIMVLGRLSVTPGLFSSINKLFVILDCSNLP